MFCKKCGQEILENMKFCPKCGGKVNSSEMSGKTSDTMEDTKKHRLVGIAFLAICFLLILSFINGKGYKKAVKDYYKAIQKIDADSYYSLLAPDYVRYMVGPGSWYSTTEEFKEELRGELRQTRNNFENMCGRNPRISVKILETDTYTAHEVSELSKQLKDNYEFFHNVSDVIKVYCQLTVRGNSKEISENRQLYLIKIGGKWYLQKGYVDETWQDY